MADPADQFTVQVDPITNAPVTPTGDVSNLEVDVDEMTEAEIDTALAKYTPARTLLFLYDARERMLKSGQENWNGDKKSFEVRFDYIQNAIEKTEKEVKDAGIDPATGKRKRRKCPITPCKVTIID